MKVWKAGGAGGATPCQRALQSQHGNLIALQMALHVFASMHTPCQPWPPSHSHRGHKSPHKHHGTLPLAPATYCRRRAAPQASAPASGGRLYSRPCPSCAQLAAGGGAGQVLRHAHAPSSRQADTPHEQHRQARMAAPLASVSKLNVPMRHTAQARPHHAGVSALGWVDVRKRRQQLLRKAAIQTHG